MKLHIEYILEMLRDRDWSESELARRAGVSSATISRILSGQRGAGSRTLAGIRRAFPDEPTDKLLFFRSIATEW